MPDDLAARSQLPRYVHACADGSWHLRLVNTETGEEMRVPYRCRSWRHEGACRRALAAMDGQRIATALKSVEGPLAYVVLTVDPNEWDAPENAYLGIYPAWNRLRERVRYRWGAFRYVAVLEQHRSGWPHVNLVLTGGIAAAVRRDWRKVRKELARMAVGSGFGMRLWVEPVRQREAIGLYLGKLTGEISKTSQVPVRAPKGFRRLRASRGFLPPRPKGAEWTGELVFAEMPVEDTDTDRPDPAEWEPGVRITSDLSSSSIEQVAAPEVL